MCENVKDKGDVRDMGDTGDTGDTEAAGEIYRGSHRIRMTLSGFMLTSVDESNVHFVTI